MVQPQVSQHCSQALQPACKNEHHSHPTGTTNNNNNHRRSDADITAGSTLSSPIRPDKLAAFHDLVTSPRGLAAIAANGGGGSGGGGSLSPDTAARPKKPRLQLDLPALVRDTFPLVVV